MPEDDSKKSRGRPRKIEDERPAKQPRLNDDGTPRKRGRPRKPGSVPVVKKPTLNPDGTPRKRGRPKKSDVAAGNTPTNKAKPAARKTAFSLNNIVGIYEVKCSAVENDWPQQAQEMELSITTAEESPLGLIAGFELGILEGTMLIATDKTKLNKFVDEMSKGEGRRRYHHGNGEISGGYCDIDNSGEDTSRRVYFRWRGRETGEGEIHSNDRTQGGYIDFSPDNTTFEAYGGFPALGEKCKFTGSKLDDESYEPEPWSNFSPEMAEAARVDRWK